jgi:hypothetical protein
MTLKQEQLEGGIVRVILEGTLDIEGTAAETWSSSARGRSCT